jgi:hypothetical protein
MKHVRLGVTNPLLGLTLAVLAALLGFVLSFIASAKIILAFVAGLNGIGTAVWCGLSFGLAFAVISFIFVWKKLNP